MVTIAIHYYSYSYKAFSAFKAFCSLILVIILVGKSINELYQIVKLYGLA